MSSPVTITLMGIPQGKGRARAFVRGGHVGHYTPEKTRSYEGMIRTAAMQELEALQTTTLDEPVEFVLRAVFPVPASWSERKRQQAITGAIKPAKKPDLDNIAKAWNDALNGVVYRDDSLICRMTLDKRYGPQPLVVVTVKPMATGERSPIDAVNIVTKTMQNRMRGDFGHELPPEEFWIDASEIVQALADAGIPLEVSSG